MSNLQTQHNKVIRALPNAAVLCTVSVIITLKAILTENVGCELSFLPGDPMI